MTEAPGPEVGDAGDMDVWSLSLNWWLAPYMNLNVNYRYTTLDRYGVEGSSKVLIPELCLYLSKIYRQFWAENRHGVGGRYLENWLRMETA
jgi:hypothetical protein